MSDSFGKPIGAWPARIGAAALVFVAASMAAPPSAWPQAPAAPALAAPPPGPGSTDKPADGSPPAERRDNPGLINEIGKLWDKSSSMLPSLLPSGEVAAPTAPDVAVPPPPLPEARNPPPAVAAPPPPEPAPSAALVPSMVSGRMQCPVAGNGAPDCKAGADKLCQSKGYRDGKNLTSDSVEACSAKRLIPGRERKPDDCRTNYFVTRAFCQ